MNFGNPLFPIFLKLDQVNTLIVGGGEVGLEKLEGLLKNDPSAEITLISPIIHPKIVERARYHSSLVLKKRRFRRRDLRGTDILILATDNQKLHGKIRVLARRRRILTNVADTPDLCDFYLGSTVKKGDLKIGISTNGKSPTFSKRFRQVLEEVLPAETDELLQNLRHYRDRLKGDFGEKVKKLNDLTKDLI